MNSELSMSWVDPRVGSGRVRSGFCSFRWVRLGWVEYDKSTIFLMITQHNCIPVQLLGNVVRTPVRQFLSIGISFYFMVINIMCSDRIDINCRQFCC